MACCAFVTVSLHLQTLPEIRTVYMKDDAIYSTSAKATKVNTMQSCAIRAEGLTKLYRLGSTAPQSDTFAGTFAMAVSSPWRNLQRLRSLTKVREPQADTFAALNDVSFEIQCGEVVGVVGRNGAGKSTLLKVLARIVEPSSGCATLRGRVASLLEVGTGFHPDLTGRENVYMNGTLLGMSKKEIDRKFDSIVEFSGGAQFLDTPIKRYSSGMQVRLAFAVAAHLDPDILIVDEVLAVGDAEFQRRCIGKMQEVAKSGRTVLFVSHNMAAVGQLCTSGLLLSGGRVAARGDLQSVLHSYMQDLIQTQSSAGDESLRVNVQMTINEESCHVWRIGETLTVSVCLWSREAVSRPAVDLYLNSSYGRMVFVQSDQLAPEIGTASEHAWEFQFELHNNGFVSDYISLDVGFRFSSATRYLRLWRSLAAVALGPLPEGFSRGRDCPVAVPCRVAVRGVAA